MNKEKSMIDFPVVCINLKRAENRRQKIESWWRDALKHQLSFFEAFDGKDPKTRKKLPVLKFVENRRVNTYSASACLMSHLAVMRKALSEGIVGPNGIGIMEDDAMPIEGLNVFEEVNKARQENPNLNMLVLTPPLFGGWTYTPKKYVSYPNETRVSNAGCHFVWYSKRGLEIYIENFKSFPDFADAFRRLPNNGTMGRLANPIARQCKNLPSTIGYI